MEQSSGFPITRIISSLEDVVGRLSPIQKMLLGTDGSVTGLLEIITGSPVEIETLVQKTVAADEEVAADLGVDPGECVNYRVVKLKKAKDGETLIYAVSHTPLKRLEESFKEDMTRADIPIGVILKKHRIESRREITGAGFLEAGQELGRIFNVFPRELMLSRNYKIIRQGEPIIAIRETFPYNSFLDAHKIVIETPSRIHMTLTDLSGSSDRVDGGVGITLDEPNILLEAERSSEMVVEGKDAENAMAAALAVREHFGLGCARLLIRKGFKSHVGLGSGTQLRIAAGMALCKLYHQPATVPGIARIVRRGGTSGIGTAAYETGGFIVDGGHTFGLGREKMDFRPSSAAGGTRPPQVIARHDFPRDWTILLAMPDIPKGAHGQKEVDVFRDFCPVPLADVHELCYQILVRMVPSLVEEDLEGFGAAVNRVQNLGFKKVELMLQHPVVPRLMEQMRHAGAACSGLSSFGPTVYAITDTSVRDVEAAAYESMREVGGEVIITRSRNEGARIRAA